MNKMCYSVAKVSAQQSKNFYILKMLQSVAWQNILRTIKKPSNMHLRLYSPELKGSADQVWVVHTLVSRIIVQQTLLNLLKIPTCTPLFQPALLLKQKP